VLELLGHERQRKLLAARPAQSLLFVGPQGVGRKAVAEWFARGLNCQRGFPPCGECESCRLQDHPDFRLIEPMRFTKAGQLARRPQIRLEQIAPRAGSAEMSLLEWLQTSPRYRAKVAVIDSAHLLGEQAGNALLKLLEEPPSYAYIVLIAPSREALLPTLASRSMTLNFGPLSRRELSTLSNDEVALGYSEGAVGRLRLALSDPAGLREAEAAAREWLSALASPAQLLRLTARLRQLAQGKFDPWTFVQAGLTAWPAEYRSAAYAAFMQLQDDLSAYVSPELAYTRLALAMRRIYAEMRAGSPVSR